MKTFNEVLVLNASLPKQSLEKKIFDNHSKIGHLRYCGTNISTKIIKWLYADLNSNSRFLDRKYQIIKPYL